MARNTRTFSDLDAAFTANPRTRDVAAKYDDAAIRNSLRNLINTKNFERPFAPNIGCQIHSLLFENLTPFTINIAERTITDVITKFEPRVELLSVDISPDNEGNAIDIEILFRIRNTEITTVFNTTLSRVR